MFQDRGDILTDLLRLLIVVALHAHDEIAFFVAGVRAADIRDAAIGGHDAHVGVEVLEGLSHAGDIEVLASHDD